MSAVEKKKINDQKTGRGAAQRRCRQADREQFILEAAFDELRSPFDLVMTQQEAFEQLRHRDVKLYRTKTVKAGKVLECEVYPIYARREDLRAAKTLVTDTAQKRVNDRNAAKRIVRLINQNFDENDLALTLTYRGTQPELEQARKDIRKYLRKLRTLYARMFPGQQLKYLYVIEFMGADGRRKRVHHHVMISGMNRDLVEKLWPYGRANSMRLQPDEYGLEAIGRYISKAPRTQKRWACSRNLEEPKIMTADSKVKKAHVAKVYTMVKEQAAQTFEKLYPGYRLLDVDVRSRAGLPGCYIYARLTCFDEMGAGRCM